jgi:hypothetical protein
MNLDVVLQRRLLLESLYFRRIPPLEPQSITPACAWLTELAGTGRGVPPLGFIADIGNLMLALDENNVVKTPAYTAEILTRYESVVLEQLYADWSFARASAAARRYEGRAAAKILAFLMERWLDRIGYQGLPINHSLLRELAHAGPERLLAEGWQTLQTEGPCQELLAEYAALVRGARQQREAFGAEDIFEVERGTALQGLGERIALRQTLQTMTLLEAALPRVKPASGNFKQHVPTRLLDEDAYPIGGYTSLATKGSMESLLQSQLAYMETERREHFDLFDLMYLNNELFYYSRDENQFRRRRLLFACALYPDLRETHFKDPGYPCQRIILILAFLTALVRRSADWLATDALSYRFLLLDEASLAFERKVLETTLGDLLELGICRIDVVRPRDVASLCKEWSGQHFCHCLQVGVKPPRLQARNVAIFQLHAASPRPTLKGENIAPEDRREEAEDGHVVWAQTLTRLLTAWL